MTGILRAAVGPTSLIIVAAIFMAEPIQAQNKERDVDDKVVIDGFVFDSQGNALPGVVVSIHPSDKPGAAGSCVSDIVTGKYSFKANMGSSFDIVYTHSKYDPAVVSLLANSKPQHISKIL